MRNTLLTLLLAALLITTASAATVTVSDVTIQRDSTATATITLTGADSGLSGYSLTASVSGTAARITKVDFPAWAVIHSAGDLPASSVTLDAVDLNNAVTGPSATLATLTLSGINPGTGTISVTISSMDDDTGQPITPATESGSYSVTIAPGGTDYPLCDGLTLSISSITSKSATFTGSTPDPDVWIVLGTAPGKYGYRTANITASGGTYSGTLESYPLIAGQTYYARAATPHGYSAETTWTMAAAGAAPTTTYGTRADAFQASNMSLLTLWDYTLETGGETFGGGDTGTIIFISLIGAVAFIVLFGRAGDVIIPLEIGVLTIGIILPLLAPEFAEIGYGLMVAAVLGVAYSIFRKVV